MEFGNLNVPSSVVLLLVGIGVLLLGFKLLGDSIQKLSAKKMRALFDKAVSNRVSGVGVGALATAIVQSSAVTTVMVVGFVNAGVMSLMQAAAVIMGANIGTTITGWLVWLNQFNIMLYAMLLALIGLVITMVSKNNKVNTAGMLVASLGIVFVGLEIMSGSMEILSESDAIQTALSSISNPFLLLLLGALITGVVQSSSAVTSVLVTMATLDVPLLVGGGGNGTLFVLLGTNIGSCITSLLSSIGTNTNAKRASIFHLLFNTFGAVIFFIILCIWDDFFDGVLMGWFNNYSTCITFFHTAFNLICTLLFLPFIKYLVKLLQIIVPEGKKAKKGSEGFMDKRLLLTPSLAIGQLVKQTTYAAGIAMKSLNTAIECFINMDEGKLDNVQQDIQKVNSISEEITNYLIQISAKDVSLSDERFINALHKDNIDLVRIADIAGNIIGYTQKEVEETLIFSDKVKQEIVILIKLLNEQFELVVDIVENNNIVKIRQSDVLEQKIDATKKRLLDEHIQRMIRGECNAENNSLFVSLVSNLERVGDHLSLMAHSVEEAA